MPCCELPSHRWYIAHPGVPRIAYGYISIPTRRKLNEYMNIKVQICLHKAFCQCALGSSFLFYFIFFNIKIVYKNPGLSKLITFTLCHMFHLQWYSHSGWGFQLRWAQQCLQGVFQFCSTRYKNLLSSSFLWYWNLPKNDENVVMLYIFSTSL